MELDVALVQLAATDDAQATDEIGIIWARIETDRVAAVRLQIPVLANRRPEAYRLS